MAVWLAGILTLSSVCPILAVLVSGFLPCCTAQPIDADAVELQEPPTPLAPETPGRAHAPVPETPGRGDDLERAGSSSHAGDAWWGRTWRTLAALFSTRRDREHQRVGTNEW